MANKEIKDFTSLATPLPPDKLLVQDDSGVTKYTTFHAFRDGFYKSYDGLLLKRNATNPNYQVDLDYTTLWIEGVKSSAGNFTLDITASGALGLDTGSESADAWYYIWSIAKADGTVSAILSASATSPSLPSGYIYKRLVSWVRNTSGNFVPFLQEDKTWGYVSEMVVKISSSFENEILYCPDAIPVGAKYADVIIRCYTLDSAAVTQNIVTLYQFLNDQYTFYKSQYSNVIPAASDCFNYVYGKVGATSRSVKYQTQDVSSATTIGTYVSISALEIAL
jgi:hypothetical protein